VPGPGPQPGDGEPSPGITTTPVDTTSTTPTAPPGSGTTTSVSHPSGSIYGGILGPYVPVSEGEHTYRLQHELINFGEQCDGASLTSEHRRLWVSVMAPTG
jgi:hypothetical protein